MRSRIGVISSARGTKGIDLQGQYLHAAYGGNRNFACLIDSNITGASRDDCIMIAFGLAGYSKIMGVSYLDC